MYLLVAQLHGVVAVDLFVQNFSSQVVSALVQENEPTITSMFPLPCRDITQRGPAASSIWIEQFFFPFMPQQLELQNHRKTAPPTNPMEGVRPRHVDPSPLLRGEVLQRGLCRGRSHVPGVLADADATDNTRVFAGNNADVGLVLRTLGALGLPVRRRLGVESVDDRMSARISLGTWWSLKGGRLGLLVHRKIVHCAVSGKKTLCSNKPTCPRERPDEMRPDQIPVHFRIIGLESESTVPHSIRSTTAIPCPTSHPQLPDSPHTKKLRARNHFFPSPCFHMDAFCTRLHP